MILIWAATALVSCSKDQKVMNERLTLWRKDKIPYGTFYAFESLPKLFPDAEIVTEKAAVKQSGLLDKVNPDPIKQKMILNNGNVVKFIVTPAMMPTKEEWKELQNFVWEGNQLFISAMLWDTELLDSLNLSLGLNNPFMMNGGDSLTVSIAHPLTEEEMSFSYPGQALDNYFSAIDTGFTAVLGWNKKGKPNFIRLNYNGGGALFLHLAPVTFSNFFLLHKDNNEYYNEMMSYLRHDAALVNWNDYFRNSNSTQNSTARIFSWLMKQPPLAWALYLLLFLFACIYLFGSKRRQRMIPVKAPLRNSSLDFVKTIGRLYFQRRDNKNLVQKMTTHFQTHVRSRYNIPSFHLDEEFEKRLSYKSGQPQEAIHQLVYQMKYLGDQSSVSDDALMAFNQQLENFYKQA